MTFQELYSFVESEARKLDLSKLRDKNEVYVADITGDNGGKICAVLKDGRLAVSGFIRRKRLQNGSPERIVVFLAGDSSFTVQTLQTICHVGPVSPLQMAIPSYS